MIPMGGRFQEWLQLVALVPEEVALVPEEAALVPEDEALVPEEVALVPEDVALVPEEVTLPLLRQSDLLILVDLVAVYSLKPNSFSERVWQSSGNLKLNIFR